MLQVMPPAESGRATPDTSTPPACPRCVKDGGLCVGCAENDRAILPQLAQDRRLRALRGKGGNVSYVGLMAPATPPEPPALPALGSPGRRQLKRLGRAIAGQFTRATRVA